MSGNCTDPSWLGDLFAGQCEWSTNGWPDVNGDVGEHFFPEIETVFVKQFDNTDNYDPIYNSYLNISNQLPKWGNVNINAGFQYFQYGLNDVNILSTNYPALVAFPNTILRLEDTWSAIMSHENCAGNAQIITQIINTEPQKLLNVSLKNQIEIKIEPNPITETGTVTIKNTLDEKMVDNRIYNMVGEDCSSDFELSISGAKGTLSILRLKAVTGHYILRVITERNVINIPFQLN
ncbi:MAG: hypothetical protein IPO27_15125 [Bacteroidetes bacterium]|nr:hypothetical protein [Bacteroidota bacterium]